MTLNGSQFQKRRERKETYTRHSVVSIEDVLSAVPDDITEKLEGEFTPIAEFSGIPVNMSSLRYLTFKHKGTKCNLCGLEAAYFALEKHRTSDLEVYHFNLYGLDPKTNQEILMTKDHIIAKIKGGSDSLNNLQTLCSKCNSKKGAEDWKVIKSQKEKNKIMK